MSEPANWIGDEPSIVDAIIAAFPLPGSNKLTSLGIALVGDAVLASDWLAAHDARIAADARADERERIALAIEAESRNTPRWSETWRKAFKEAATIARAATDTDYDDSCTTRKADTT